MIIRKAQLTPHVEEGVSRTIWRCKKKRSSGRRMRTSRGEWEEEEDDDDDVFLREELQERVLARLPIREVFRLRCVCKAWNRILRSPKFFALHSQSAPSETWLLMRSNGFPLHKMFLMFLPATASWLRTPFPLLDDPGLSCHYERAGSAGGLICFPATPNARDRLAGSLEVRFFVVNILTRCVKTLPRVPYELFCQEKLLVRLNIFMSSDSVKNTYRVFLVPNFCAPVAIYDSSTQEWIIRFTNVRSTQIIFSPGCLTKISMVHGKLFATVSTQPDKYVAYFNIFFSFDVDEGNWNILDLQYPDEGLPLWVCTGSILLGCADRSTVLVGPDLEPGGTCHGFVVWDSKRRHFSAGKWVEVARTPRAAQWATQKAERFMTLFCSNRNFILMTGVRSNAGGPTQYMTPVLYDVALNRWESLPPLPPHLARRGYCSWMMLEPNLAATP